MLWMVHLLLIKSNWEHSDKYVKFLIFDIRNIYTFLHWLIYAFDLTQNNIFTKSI